MGRQVPFREVRPGDMAHHQFVFTNAWPVVRTFPDGRITLRVTDGRESAPEWAEDYIFIRPDEQGDQ